MTTRHIFFTVHPRQLCNGSVAEGNSLGSNGWTALVAVKSLGHLLLNPRHKLYGSIILPVSPQGAAACCSFVGPRGNTKTRHGVIPLRRELQQCNSLFLFNVPIPSVLQPYTVCPNSLNLLYINNNTTSRTKYFVIVKVF
jgi:hypothetical protein